MLTFEAKKPPCKGTKKLNMYKKLLSTFGFLLIFISCNPLSECLEHEMKSSAEARQDMADQSDTENNNQIINGVNDMLSRSDTAKALFYLSLNEILFDPVPLSCDYIEIVNRSEYPVNLAEISLCNRNTRGELGSPKALSRDKYILEPGAYCLLTSDLESLSREFSLDSTLQYLIIKSMPSMPNEKGCVVLLDRAGNIIDEFSYTSSMHHSLLSNKEGVALEKIHPDLPSADPGSWLSASADAGYGTPGRINSQYRSLASADVSQGFYAEQHWFSPYGNSKYNIWLLHYAFEDQRLANIGVYNRSGALIYTLANNALLGARGFFVWQGTDDRNLVPDAGSYLVHIEHFNLSGDLQKQNMVCRLLP